MAKEKMFPVEYNGKLWHKKDCDAYFLSIYNDRAMLQPDGGVYFTDGITIYPDGTTEDDGR